MSRCRSVTTNLRGAILNKTQMVRLSELDEQIRQHKFPTLKSFIQEYGPKKKRTIQRDLKFLKETLNAPLAVHPTRRGYYYKKDWEFPKVIVSAKNRACHLFQLVKHLKALSSSDRQYVIDQSSPPPPSRPPTGLATFSIGPLDLTSFRSSPLDNLIAQLRELSAGERRLVLDSI